MASPAYRQGSRIDARAQRFERGGPGSLAIAGGGDVSRICRISRRLSRLRHCRRAIGLDSGHKTGAETIAGVKAFQLGQ